ncbi:MAG: hypothetical protein EPO64_02255 [Nitrospirae bacterium]|nr:MAG: hypothetical protein EPO64_02255 [Nitrospirota bacterium]
MKLVCLVLVLALVSSMTGCAGMTDEQQRLLSGGGIGTAGGVALTALTGGSVLIGAVVGGAAGVAGGALVNEQERTKSAKTAKGKKTSVAQRQETKAD